MILKPCMKTCFSGIYQAQQNTKDIITTPTPPFPHEMHEGHLSFYMPVHIVCLPAHFTSSSFVPGWDVTEGRLDDMQLKKSM